MKRQSEKERARRARRRELFAARLCLLDCGRPMSRTENLCEQCSATLVEQYFARLGAAGNGAQTAPERVGGIQPPPEPCGCTDAALAHEHEAVSEPAPPDPGGFVRVVKQKAPDLHGGVILTAFGAAVTAWLLSVLSDDVSLLLSFLLPPLVGYEIGAQGAGKAPQGGSENHADATVEGYTGRRSTPARSRSPQPVATGEPTRMPNPSPRPHTPVVSSQCAAGSCAPTQHQAAPPFHQDWTWPDRPPKGPRRIREQP